MAKDPIAVRLGVTIPAYKQLIYTRWVRAYKHPSWRRDSNVMLWMPTKGKKFRLILRGFGFDLSIHPISKAEWQRVRPQHIFGYEFDKPAKEGVT